MTDHLIGEPRRAAIQLTHVTWSGRTGQLVLTPPYPSGGEIGGHLAFCYRTAGVNYAVTLHAWTPSLRYTAEGASGELRLEATPTTPTVIATLRTIVSSAQ